MTVAGHGYGEATFVEPADDTFAVWYHSYELAAENGSKVFRGDFGMGADWLEKEGTLPTPETLSATHVYLGDVRAEDLDACHTLMQGEVWSPAGEARDFIEGKGLTHTSMSTGDVVVDRSTGHHFFCDRIGWKRLEASVPRPLPRP